MICTVCGRHFCYVCGQDWAMHQRQTGGIDYFRCGLSAQMTEDISAPLGSMGSSGVAGDAWRKRRAFDAALTGWVANERDSCRQNAFLGALQLLAEAVGLGFPYGRTAKDALHACFEARQCLQRCYVLKYNWSATEWQGKLDKWVGELEGSAGALENAVGLVLVEAEYTRLFPVSTEAIPTDAFDFLSCFDLRQLLPHVVAASEHTGALQQLTTAVVLQRNRILDAGRMGFPGLGPRALVLAAAQAAAQVAGDIAGSAIEVARARGPGCIVT